MCCGSSQWPGRLPRWFSDQNLCRRHCWCWCRICLLRQLECEARIPSYLAAGQQQFPHTKQWPRLCWSSPCCPALQSIDERFQPGFGSRRRQLSLGRSDRCEVLRNICIGGRRKDRLPAVFLFGFGAKHTIILARQSPHSETPHPPAHSLQTICLHHPRSPKTFRWSSSPTCLLGDNIRRRGAPPLFQPAPVSLPGRALFVTG